MDRREPAVFARLRLAYLTSCSCAHGPQYDLLAAQNPPQLASVYYIGVNVLSHPEEAQRGYTQGLAIGVHTWSHHSMTTLTNEQVFAELYCE